jgi:hypothetical protein
MPTAPPHQPPLLTDCRSTTYLFQAESSAVDGGRESDVASTITGPFRRFALSPVRATESFGNGGVRPVPPQNDASNARNDASNARNDASNARNDRAYSGPKRENAIESATFPSAKAPETVVCDATPRPRLSKDHKNIYREQEKYLRL